MVQRTERDQQRNRLCIAADHHDAVILVYDEAGKVIETHEHAGDFREARVDMCGILASLTPEKPRD
jgi:hypothetical protein